MFTMGETVVLTMPAAGSAKQGDVDVEVVPVPEPSALVLAGLVLTGLFLIRRRK